MIDAYGLPGLDCHAHVAPDVTTSQLASLGDIHIFAMTRSLAEAAAVAQRRDPGLTWGLGIHPGVASARSAYDPDRFRTLLPSFALVGEVGLDRRAGLSGQARIFSDVMDACRDQPVLISIHSAGRTAEVVDSIDRYKHPGTILHWFLGTSEERTRALAAGAYFSVNVAMDDHILRTIPLERQLPETDFPARRVGARWPGWVSPLEERLSQLWDLPTAEIRHQLWRNLKAIAVTSGTLDAISDELADKLLAL